MTIRSYSINDRSGRIVTLKNGEYIQCEQGTESIGLLWSSALPFGSMVDKMLNTMRSKVEFKLGIVIDRFGSITEGDWTEALAAARRGLSDVTFFRLDSEEFAFTWRSNVGESDSGKIPVHECCLLSTIIDDDLASGLVRELGTEGVGTNNSVLMSNFDELVAAYPHRRTSGTSGSNGDLVAD
ncbi:hypothetical protein [Arthrobacter globiformis]|uniref:hypothetical protein n=1 Tax=Arthrobacter globiformis TaxID=1665 RepID=UPI00397DD78B